MSRQDLHEFLVHRLKLKDITPEREELIASVMTEGRRMGTRTVVFHAASIQHHEPLAWRQRNSACVG